MRPMGGGLRIRRDISETQKRIISTQADIRGGLGGVRLGRRQRPIQLPRGHPQQVSDCAFPMKTVRGAAHRFPCAATWGDRVSPPGKAVGRDSSHRGEPIAAPKPNGRATLQEGPPAYVPLNGAAPLRRREEDSYAVYLHPHRRRQISGASAASGPMVPYTIP